MENLGDRQCLTVDLALDGFNVAGYAPKSTSNATPEAQDPAGWYIWRPEFSRIGPMGDEALRERLPKLVESGMWVFRHPEWTSWQVANVSVLELHVAG